MARRHVAIEAGSEGGGERALACAEVQGQNVVACVKFAGKTFTTDQAHALAAAIDAAAFKAERLVATVSEIEVD